MHCQARQIRSFTTDCIAKQESMITSHVNFPHLVPIFVIRHTNLVAREQVMRVHRVIMQNTTITGKESPYGNMTCHKLLNRTFDLFQTLRSQTSLLAPSSGDQASMVGSKSKASRNRNLCAARTCDRKPLNLGLLPTTTRVLLKHARAIARKTKQAWPQWLYTGQSNKAPGLRQQVAFWWEDLEPHTQGGPAQNLPPSANCLHKYAKFFPAQ